MLVFVLGLLAHFLLRSASRRRIWDRLGRHPSLSAETRLVGATGSILFAILATGFMLLVFGVVAGAAVIGLYAALIIYGLFVPHYSRRLILRAIESEAQHSPPPGRRLGLR